MTTTIDLSNLSIESSEIDFDAPPGDELTDEVDNPTFGQPFEDMQTVYGIWNNITVRKHVCRDDMEQVKKLAGSYPSLEKLLKKHPVNSFSKEPSRINYDVSTEGVFKTAYEAVVKALRDVIDYIADTLRAMWAFLTTSGQKTAAVDDLSAKLKACQMYIVEVDRVIAGTSLADDFRKIREGAFNNEFHNLSGKWNTFKSMQLNKPEDMHGDLDLLAGVVKVKMPTFVEMLDLFLRSLSAAKTEDEIKQAVGAISLYDMTSVKLMKLARDYGYNPAGAVNHSSLTDFQAQAGVIRSKYKSWTNERTTLDRKQFNTLISTYVIGPWAADISDTIGWAKGRTEPALKKIKEFSGGSLNPGLEEVYLKLLTPFLKILTSTLAGFTAIEQCLGQLTDNRNNVSGNIYNATAGIVKKMDAYVVANKEKFTIAEQNLLWRQRKTLAAIFV